MVGEDLHLPTPTPKRKAVGNSIGTMGPLNAQRRAEGPIYHRSSRKLSTRDEFPTGSSTPVVSSAYTPAAHICTTTRARHTLLAILLHPAQARPRRFACRAPATPLRGAEAEEPVQHSVSALKDIRTAVRGLPGHAPPVVFLGSTLWQLRRCVLPREPSRSSEPARFRAGRTHAAMEHRREGGRLWRPWGWMGASPGLEQIFQRLLLM